MRALRRLVVLAVFAAGGVLPATSAGAEISATEVASMATLTGVGCVGSGPCYAVGLDPNGKPAVIDVSGGRAGAVSEFADGSFQPLGIACGSAGDCLAVGNTVDPTSGAQVGAVAPVRAGLPGATAEVTNAATLSAVSCGSGGFCVAAGQDQSGAPGAGAYSAGGPQAFADFADTAFVPQAVGCGGQSCLVTGQDPAATDSVGALATVTPGAQGGVADTSTSSSLTGVACPATGPCVAGGYQDAGTDSFGSPRTLPVLAAVNSGAAGTGFTYSAESGGAFTAVACSPGPTCVAIGTDGSGDTITAPFLDGGAGVAQTDRAPGSFEGIQPTGLACPSGNSCLAIGTDAASNPVLATIPVPAFQALGDGPGAGSGPTSPGHGPPLTRREVRVRITVSRFGGVPVRRLLVTAICLARGAGGSGIDGVGIVLQRRVSGRRARWATVTTRVTRTIGRRSGEARFIVAARPDRRVQYRARVLAGRRLAPAVSGVVTVRITRRASLA